MAGLYEISGIGDSTQLLRGNLGLKKPLAPIAPGAKPSAERLLLTADPMELSEGELELLLIKGQLEAERNAAQRVSGIGAPEAQTADDAIEYIDEVLAARGNLGTLDALDAEWQAGGYNVSGIAAVAGIGAPDTGALRAAMRKMRQDRVRQVCECQRNALGPEPVRQLMNAQANTPGPAGQAVRRMMGRYKASEAISGAIGDDDYIYEPGVGRKPRRQQQRQERKQQRQQRAKSVKTKLKNFGKKVKNIAKKAAKGIVRAVTAPARLAVKGALEVMLRTKAANYFLYTFIPNDKAAQLPAKIQKKRNRQIRVMKFITNVIGMKEDHLKKLIRIGITKSQGKSPEVLVGELLARGRISGIGAFPLMVIGPVVELIKKIVDAFKKRPNADESPEGGEPDPSDWDSVTPDPGAAEEVVERGSQYIGPGGSLSAYEAQEAARADAQSDGGGGGGKSNTPLILGALALGGILLATRKK